MIIEIAIVCGTVFMSIISTLIYFAAFHETRKFEQLETDIKFLQTGLRAAQDDLTKIDNKVNYRGKRL